jgi:hypothetical protein
MSVWPVAADTRTSDGTGIIASAPGSFETRKTNSKLRVSAIGFCVHPVECRTSRERCCQRAWMAPSGAVACNRRSYPHRAPMSLEFFFQCVVP